MLEYKAIEVTENDPQKAIESCVAIANKHGEDGWRLQQIMDHRELKMGGLIARITYSVILERDKALAQALPPSTNIRSTCE